MAAAEVTGDTCQLTGYRLLKKDYFTLVFVVRLLLRAHSKRFSFCSVQDFS